MGRQPVLRSLLAFGEMDEFGMVAGPVEDTAAADRRTFDDGEHKAGVQRKRAMDVDRNHTTAAIITFMQREATSLIIPSDQPAAAVVRLPG